MQNISLSETALKLSEYMRGINEILEEASSDNSKPFIRLEIFTYDNTAKVRVSRVQNAFQDMVKELGVDTKRELVASPIKLGTPYIREAFSLNGIEFFSYEEVTNGTEIQ